MEGIGLRLFDLVDRQIGADNMLALRILRANDEGNAYWSEARQAAA